MEHSSSRSVIERSWSAGAADRAHMLDQDLVGLARRFSIIAKDEDLV